MSHWEHRSKPLLGLWLFPPGGGSVYPVQQQRPAGITLLAILTFVGGAFSVIGGISLIFLIAFDPTSALLWSGLGAFTLLLGILYLFIGWGLWSMRPWARTAGIVIAIISLFAFPIGTIFGIIVLWYLFRPEIKAAFGAGPPVMAYPPPGYPPAPYAAPPPAPGAPPPAPAYPPPAYPPPVAPAPAAAELRCKNCGAPLQPGVAFCPNCGSKVA